MNNINFIDVADFRYYNKTKNYWNVQNYKCILAFRDEDIFLKWQEIMNNFARVNQILKPNIINDYEIQYHKCIYNPQIKFLINNLLSPASWPMNEINKNIERCRNKFWMIVGFSYQDYQNDPIHSCMKHFIDFMKNDEDSNNIDFDRIGMEIILCGKEEK